MNMDSKYKKPLKSSFLSVEKDFNIIVREMLKNERLKKLLYYEVPLALSMPDLDETQTLSLINKNIKIVPRIPVDEEALNYIIIGFDSFETNEENPEFRNNLVTFDIISHMDLWNLGDFKLRPYKIAGEIDGMFNSVPLTGVGKLEFVTANLIILSNELGGLTLVYQALHFSEDKV